MSERDEPELSPEAWEAYFKLVESASHPIPRELDEHLCRALRSRDEEIERLRAFVAALFEASDWPEGGDIDGFEFQDLAERNGILIAEIRTKPCCDSCYCDEYHGDMSGGVKCLRKAPWLVAELRRALGLEEKP